MTNSQILIGHNTSLILDRANKKEWIKTNTSINIIYTMIVNKSKHRYDIRAELQR